MLLNLNIVSLNIVSLRGNIFLVTNIFISAENKEEAYNMANNVLKCVCTYLKLNQLHINLSKCAMCIYVFQTKFEYL